MHHYAPFNQHRCDSRRITYSFALGGARLLLIMEHTRAELHVSICPLNWRCQSIKTRKGHHHHSQQQEHKTVMVFEHRIPPLMCDTTSIAIVSRLTDSSNLNAAPFIRTNQSTNETDDERRHGVLQLSKKETRQLNSKFLCEGLLECWQSIVTICDESIA